MKVRNVFACQIAKGSGIVRWDGEAYITKRASSLLQASIENKNRAEQQLQKRSRLPYPLQIFEYICFLTAVFCLVLVIKGIGAVTLAEMYAQRAWIFYVFPVSLLLGLVLLFAGIRLGKNAVQTSEAEHYAEAAVKVVDQSEEELGVPADAEIIDIMIEPYRVNKNGKKRQVNPFVRNVAMPMSLYVRDECLCLASLDMVFSIPLRAFVSVRKVNRFVQIGSWNKPEPYRSARYKQYKVRPDGNGILYTKPYCIIDLADSQGNFQMLIPAYELEIFSKYVHAPVLT